MTSRNLSLEDLLDREIPTALIKAVVLNFQTKVASGG